MTDEFEKSAGHALRGLAVGAAGAVAATLDPTLGLAAAVAVDGAADWFQRYKDRNTEILTVLRIEELHEYFIRLDERVRRIEAAQGGPAQDMRSHLTKEAVYSDFAQTVATTPSPEKRAALVHAAAALHDPTLGSLPTRLYWWDLVKQLPDSHVQTILWVGTDVVVYSMNIECQGLLRGSAADPNRVTRTTETGRLPDDGSVTLTGGPSEFIEAFLSIAHTLASVHRPPLFRRRPSSRSERINHAEGVDLTPAGAIVHSMISGKVYSSTKAPATETVE